MTKLILILVLAMAIGCGGRQLGNSDGHGTIYPCPPYCEGK